jgi:hypothetical protein
MKNCLSELCIIYQQYSYINTEIRTQISVRSKPLPTVGSDQIKHILI